MTRSNWRRVPFEDAIVDETGGNIKTQQAEFRSQGQFPIVDQGKALIGGYTNDPNRLCRARLPVIVFGDHTRHFKFVDFPFCLGADGAKILRPRVEAHEKYLFHYLRQIQIPDAGYDRHFKYLKRTEIWLPSIEEQRRIAAVLDQADELRRKRREAIEKLNGLGRAVFLEMFGDPVLNVRKWPTRKLGEVGELERGVSKHRPRNEPALLNGPYPLIQTGDIANCDGYIREYTSSYSEVGLRQSRLWPKGTLCITIAANIGKTGILLFDACFPDSVVGFTPLELVTTEYVQSWMSFVQRKLEADAPEFAQKNINLAILRELPIPAPPVRLQMDFTTRVTEIDRLRTACRDHLAKLEALFASLQHRAFSGELTSAAVPAELEAAG